MGSNSFGDVYDMMYKTFRRSMGHGDASVAAKIHARKYIDKLQGTSPTQSGTLRDRIADIA